MVGNFAVFGRKIPNLRKSKNFTRYIISFDLPFPLWEILWWEDPKKFPRSPQKNTLVRKFPLFPPKRYSGGIKLNLPDLFYARPGGPPLREYKQPMAMYITSPHPGPIKKRSEIEISPVLLWKDTLVRKFPRSPPKDTLVRRSQKTPPFSPRKILWWE